jgi:putative endonuclease
MRDYYVYIMSNKSRMIYIGVTNDLERRVYEHKNKLTLGFTSKFNLDKVVYFEPTDDVTIAIAREKELKGWVRRKKTALINTMNPEWKDLSEEWYDSPIVVDG